MAFSIAALILTYRYPAGITALTRFFHEAEIDTYIHVDAKVDAEPFIEAACLSTFTNVIFVRDRVEVFWRGFSMIEATMRLLQIAKSHRHYDRFVIVSDDSIPIVSPQDMRQMLQLAVEYTAAGPAPPEFFERYRRFFMLDSKTTQVRWISDIERVVTTDVLPRLTRLEALRNKGKKPLVAYFHGSQWMGLTATAVDGILSSWSSDVWLRESFEFSEVPDESYFQTIMAQEVWRPLMYVDWSTHLPPRVFKTIDEISTVDSQGAMFLRKVDLTPDDLDTWLAKIIG